MQKRNMLILVFGAVENKLVYTRFYHRCSKVNKDRHEQVIYVVDRGHHDDIWASRPARCRQTRL